jgi:hypothetical protein
MKKLLRIVSVCFMWAATAPNALLGLATAAFIRAAWGQESRWSDGVWFVVLARDSWPMSKTKRWGGWYAGWGGTAFGPRSVMLAPGQESVYLIAHERHHTEQASGHAITGFAIAIATFAVGAPWLAALVWLFNPWLSYAGATIDAYARGKSGYEDNNLEVAARAVGVFTASQASK